jgi:uncharacterized protein (TIGR02145 family)
VNVCAPASITAHSPSTKSASITAGESTTLGITAAGSATLSYQWYKPASATNTGGTAVGTNSASFATPTSLGVGTHYYYCVVTSSCNASTVTSDVFTVIVNANPASLDPGSGSFTGRTTFDVAEVNTGACGTLAVRRNIAGVYANFAETTTNTQTYTFTPSGTVSNVRFAYVETSGTGIVSSLTPNGTYTGTISSACSATVVYASDLNSKVSGKTSDQAWMVDIYAIYTSSGTDYAVKLTARIQDCAFSGAYTTTGAWLTFMPYNLGATTSYATPADQMAYSSPTGATTSSVIYGDLYQWGRPTDGHQKRNSGTTTTLATSNTPGNVGFITGSYDWRSGGGNNNRWTDATKAANDPCPAGYRVPTMAQWRSIFNNTSDNGIPYATINSANTYNNWSWYSSGGTKGAYSGGTLFLPAAGSRGYSGGSLGSAGSHGHYWSSSVYGSLAYRLGFNSGSVTLGNYDDRANGFSLRCVAE